MSGNEEYVLGDLYVYVPSRVAAIVFTAAFALSFIGHIVQCWHYSAWRIIALQPLCAILFTLGYALRTYGAFDHYLYLNSTYNTNLIIFILSQVFVFVAPPLLELANYHVLGRILYYVPHLSPLPPGNVLSIFGLIMMVTELLNALGVALSSNPSSTESKQSLGSDLVRAALGLQLFVIVCFTGIAGLFQWRLHKAGLRPKRITVPIYILYISMLLIMGRSIYRLIEHAGNTAIDVNSASKLAALSPLLRHEWYFLIFESTFMCLNSYIWNIWHPGRYLPRDYLVHLTKDGFTELRSVPPPDDRPVWQKLANIFFLGLLFGPKESTYDDSNDSDPSSYHVETKKDDRPVWKKIACIFFFGLIFRPKKKTSRVSNAVNRSSYNDSTELVNNHHNPRLDA